MILTLWLWSVQEKCLLLRRIVLINKDIKHKIKYAINTQNIQKYKPKRKILYTKLVWLIKRNRSE